MPTETRCIKIKLKKNSIDAVRKWQQFILSNKEEALCTLKAEGVILEAVFLENNNEDDYLICIMTSNDFNKAKQVVATSKSFVDKFHQQFKEQCWEDGQRLENLIELYNFSD